MSFHLDRLTAQPQHLNPLELTIFKKLCSQYANPQHSLQQLKLLKQQNDMIRDVRNVIKNNSLTQRSESCLSQLSVYSNCDENDMRRSWAGGKVRESRTMCESKVMNVFGRVEDGLEVVKQRCDWETYNCLREVVNDYRKLIKTVDQSRYFETLYEKAKKSNEQARKKLSLYECRIAQLQKLTKLQPTPVQLPCQDKLKYKTLLNSLSDRQAKLTKHQTALLIKQNMVNQDQKRLKVQQSNLEKQMKQLVEERKQVDDIWEKIFEEIGADQSFVKEIQEKYKEGLVKQRKMLAEEVEELNRRHEAIEKVIQQLEGLQL